MPAKRQRDVSHRRPEILGQEDPRLSFSRGGRGHLFVSEVLFRSIRHIWTAVDLMLTSAVHAEFVCTTTIALSLCERATFGLGSIDRHGLTRREHWHRR